ncbi:MAG: CHAD domain-containing protein [Anaerolineae bacterium]|nr:CHAD domain-containing protein [Anaerolineae bacterium]
MGDGTVSGADFLVGRQLTPDEKIELGQIEQSAAGPLSRRARIILNWAAGAEAAEIARRVDLTERTVKHWLNEFKKRRMEIFPSRPEPVEAPTIDELCQRFYVDMAHARHVGTLAAELFDLTQLLHGLDERYRDVIYTGGLLHNIAYAGGRAKHHTRGRDILIENPIAGMDETTRKLIAVATVFHRKKWRNERFEKEAVYQSLSEEERYAAGWLAALIRVADGLDYSQSQTTAIGPCRVTGGNVIITVAGPYVDFDSARADDKADMWRSISGTSIFIRPASGMLSLENDGLAAGQESFVLSDTPGVLTDDVMSEVGRKILHFHFERMLKNERGTREGVDIEALHDMRVATRRMRVALRMFGDYFERDIYKRLQGGLKSAGKALGNPRDLDVFMEKTQQYLATLPVERAAELDIVQEHWKTQRDTAQEDLIAYLVSDVYRLFVDEMAEFVSIPGLGSADLELARFKPVHARHVAPGLIYAAYQGVRAYETEVPCASLETLHQLRLTAKQLRYTIEFFKEILGDEANDVTGTVVELQDHLGALNDAVVAQELLRKYMRQEAKRVRKEQQWSVNSVETPRIGGVVTYLEYREQEILNLMDTFPPVWEKVISQEIHQKLALSISIL